MSAIGAGAGEDAVDILGKIAEVFGITRDEAGDFLEIMDVNNTQYPSETYFQDILNKIPAPKFFTGKNNTRKKASENEMHVNYYNYSWKNKNYRNGIHQKIAHNKSRPQYVYKIFDLEELTNEYIKEKLKEPLINVILQEDSIGKTVVGKLYKVYCRKLYTVERNNVTYEGAETDYIFTRPPRYSMSERKHTGYELTFKMENLGSPVIPFVKELVEKEQKSVYNFYIFTKMFGPLYKALEYLRNTYKFEHGNLGLKNLMFAENVKSNEKNVDELHLKMIDFSFSSLEFQGYQIGVYRPYPKKELQPFLTLDATDLLPDIYYTKIEKMIADEYERIKSIGGSRKKSRKVRKTRKNK